MGLWVFVPRGPQLPNLKSQQCVSIGFLQEKITNPSSESFVFNLKISC